MQSFEILYSEGGRSGFGSHQRWSWIHSGWSQSGLVERVPPDPSGLPLPPFQKRSRRGPISALLFEDEPEQLNESLGPSRSNGPHLYRPELRSRRRGSRPPPRSHHGTLRSSLPWSRNSCNAILSQRGLPHRLLLRNPWLLCGYGASVSLGPGQTIRRRRSLVYYFLHLFDLHIPPTSCTGVVHLRLPLGSGPTNLRFQSQRGRPKSWATGRQRFSWITSYR